MIELHTIVADTHMPDAKLVLSQVAVATSWQLHVNCVCSPNIRHSPKSGASNDFDEMEMLEIYS